MRPTDSSQRGDSGSKRRKLQTITPPKEPATKSHRHPAIPSGFKGTSTRASKPAAGTPRNPVVYAHDILVRLDERWPQVASALRDLSPLERRVLVLSYGRGLTLREIGGEIGLSESGVCRLRARALAKVRSACAA